MNLLFQPDKLKQRLQRDLLELLLGDATDQARVSTVLMSDVAVFVHKNCDHGLFPAASIKSLHPSEVRPKVPESKSHEFELSKREGGSEHPSGVEDGESF